jgi:hypothetical protein
MRPFEGRTGGLWGLVLLTLIIPPLIDIVRGEFRPGVWAIVYLLAGEIAVVSIVALPRLRSRGVHPVVTGAAVLALAWILVTVTLTILVLLV